MNTDQREWHEVLAHEILSIAEAELNLGTPIGRTLEAVETVADFYEGKWLGAVAAELIFDMTRMMKEG